MICKRHQRTSAAAGAVLLAWLAAVAPIAAVAAAGALTAARVRASSPSPVGHADGRRAGRAAAGTRTAQRRRAHVAHSLYATDTAHLRYTSAAGSLLYEQGQAFGTLPGAMRVRLSVSATFSGSFTIYTSRGTISGHGSAKPHGSGVWESFAGTLVVTGGSGLFRHARGRAGLYGTFNRNTYALVVQTRGTLYY